MKKIIIGILLGVIISIPIVFLSLYLYALNLKLIVFSLVLVLLIVFLIAGIVVLYRKKIFKFLLGEYRENVELLGEELSILIDGQEDIVSKKESVKSIFNTLVVHYAKIQYRRTVINTLSLIMIGIAGFAGTSLLFKQNGLIQLQNGLLSNQDILIKEQNKKIDLQNQLSSTELILGESSRRSQYASSVQGLVYRLNNINNNGGVLENKRLLNEIIFTTLSLKPYRQLDESGELSKELYSREKGYILSQLVRSILDTAALDYVYKQTNFQLSDLRYLNFESAYLRGVDMSGSNLSYSSFKNAKMSDVRCVNCKATNSNLIKADLSNCVFTSSIMDKAHFDYSLLEKANFERTNVSYSTFQGAIIKELNVNGAKLEGVFITDNFIGSLVLSILTDLSNSFVKDDNWVDKICRAKPCQAHLDSTYRLDRSVLISQIYYDTSMQLPTKLQRAGGTLIPIWGTLKSLK